jgi:hypothetical protein
VQTAAAVFPSADRTCTAELNAIIDDQTTFILGVCATGVITALGGVGHYVSAALKTGDQLSGFQAWRIYGLFCGIGVSGVSTGVQYGFRCGAVGGWLTTSRRRSMAL